VKKIADVDTNIKVATTLNKDDIIFYDTTKSPFSIHGVTMDDGMFRRLPESVAEATSPGAVYVHTMCAGGRVRFVTDSPYIAISCKTPEAKKMSRMATTGTAGFDLYVDNRYFKTFVPPDDVETGYDSLIELGSVHKMREICINMPLYTVITSLYVGVKEGSEIKEAEPYRVTTPVVFYGSSITQGGCATRPGMTYQAILSRRFGFDFVSLGFAGNARAEDEIIEYIKTLNMSMFVLDYDHNAPDCAHLEATHEKMFKAVRAAKKDIPIIIMPRPVYTPTKDEINRSIIVQRTYQNAIDAGDKNVYYIDGKTLTALCKDDGFVDACHPTDLGFFSMAMAIGKLIEKEKLL